MRGERNREDWIRLEPHQDDEYLRHRKPLRSTYDECHRSDMTVGARGSERGPHPRLPLRSKGRPFARHLNATRCPISLQQTLKTGVRPPQHQASVLHFKRKQVSSGASFGCPEPPTRRSRCPLRLRSPLWSLLDGSEHPPRCTANRMAHL